MVFACTLQAQFGSLVILGKRESKHNSGELSTLSRLKGVFSDRTGLQVSEGRGGQEKRTRRGAGPGWPVGTSPARLQAKR